MKDILCNEKTLVIIAVVIIAAMAVGWSIYTGISVEALLTAIASGLFGMAGLRGSGQRAEDKPEVKK